MKKRTRREVPATQKETLFVAAYLKTLNATDAAIEAGYSAKTARQAGSRLLQRPDIDAQIRAVQATQIARVGMDAETIKADIFALATLDPIEMFTPEGRMLTLQQLPRHVRICIRSMNITVDSQGRTVGLRTEYWSKVDALKLAAQHLALLAPKEVNVNVRFPHAHLTDEELKQKMLQAAKEQ